ncbi:MAG: polysaccharide deacetylase, partial [Propionibacterium sp.]|nr:polysaccharide deacetylase [Propionibacterium sp.]
MYSTALVQTWLNQPGTAAEYPGVRIAFLTFDDGPSETTEVILDVL